MIILLLLLLHCDPMGPTAECVQSPVEQGARAGALLYLQSKGAEGS